MKDLQVWIVFIMLYNLQFEASCVPCLSNFTKTVSRSFLENILESMSEHFFCENIWEINLLNHRSYSINYENDTD